MCQMDCSERCPSCRSHALVLLTNETFFGPDHYEGWVSQDRNGACFFQRTAPYRWTEYRASMDFVGPQPTHSRRPSPLIATHKIPSH